MTPMRTAYPAEAVQAAQEALSRLLGGYASQLSRREMDRLTNILVDAAALRGLRGDALVATVTGGQF